MSTQPFTTERLPRYTRADAEVSLQLTPRDLDILRAVESFRLLTSEQIQRLTHGSDQAILRRLQKLFHAKHLDRIRPRWVDKGGSHRMVYAITNQGMSILQKEGLIDNPSKTDRSAQNRSWHYYSIEHTLLVSHIRAVLMLACQASQQHHAINSSNCQAQTEPATQPQQPKTIQAETEGAASMAPSNELQFLSWREGQSIRDSIEVALPDRYARLPIAADGFFTVQGAKGRLNFFVEADRGTMSIKKRFTPKLKAYAAYWREKKHEQKFQIKNFRVLTVTTSEKRCDNLVHAAEAEEDVRRLAPLFLFAVDTDLPLSHSESVFNKIWKMPGREELCSIV